MHRWANAWLQDCLSWLVLQSTVLLLNREDDTKTSLVSFRNSASMAFAVSVLDSNGSQAQLALSL